MLIQDTGWNWDEDLKEFVYNGQRHFHCEMCGQQEFLLENGNIKCKTKGCNSYQRILCTPITCASS